MVVRRVTCSLLEKPSTWHYFDAGVFVGLTAFIVRNLGVFVFLSFICLIFLILLETEEQSGYPTLSLVEGKWDTDGH